MLDQQEAARRRIIIRWFLAVLALVCFILVGYGLGLFKHEYHGDFTKVRLDQSPYLRDVAEPITLIKGDGQSESDSVWSSVTFEDTKHVERSARFTYTLYFSDGEVHNTLYLGRQEVSARSHEERAFLGLLQRWYRQDAEARKLTDTPTYPYFSTLTEPQKAKVIGVAIMRTLLERN